MFRTHTCLLILPALAVTMTAQSATIYVDIANCPGPGDGSIGDPYCSIQTAIDAAVDTDEILVARGTYFESIDFLGKAITLRSSDGAVVTIIDSTGFDGFDVVTCRNNEGRAGRSGHGEAETSPHVWRFHTALPGVDRTHLRRSHHPQRSVRFPAH